MGGGLPQPAGLTVRKRGRETERERDSERERAQEEYSRCTAGVVRGCLELMLSQF